VTDIPLAVLDLVPVSSGATAAQALRNSVDLAQAAERLGYTRYWFAEHHLNPGVAGTSPAVVLALTAAATSTIRIGSGAVQMGTAPRWPRSRSSVSSMRCTLTAWTWASAARAGAGGPADRRVPPRPSGCRTVF
jgi:hypothetical protein